MALIQNTLFDGKLSKIEKSIALLRLLEPEEGYWLAFSGGKDSMVIKRLCDMAGVKYEAWYNCTGIDPPELVKLIREQYPDVFWRYPKRGFFREMPHRGFPQRQNRWCCDYLKEGGGSGRLVITGVRWSESNKRSKRRQHETCYRDKTKQYVNPIISWTDSDVWDFIKDERLKYCTLYDQGWKRLGCIMCPATNGKIRKMEAERYPKYKDAYIRAFEKMYINKKTSEKEKTRIAVSRWKNGLEMFNWWMTDSRQGVIADQTVMFE